MNNNNHAVIDIINFMNRILQELIDIRAGVSHGNVRLDALETNFNQQFVAPPPPANCQELQIGVCTLNDPVQRAMLMAAPNRRGARILNSNFPGHGNPGLVRKYDALLQRLDQLNNASRRRKMQALARDVVELVLLEHPNALDWKDVDDSDQMSYALTLEDRVFTHHHYAIHLCKKQWYARNLLLQGFKAVRARAAQRAQREEAPVANQQGVAQDLEEDTGDDNASTTSNILE
ncbi:hypothetical protein BD408DRAFT_407594 [Parasitella parasitica]|nr:hypothetical protein BD408DRAFT_407594 [Parasitella parasitica]